MSSLNLDQLLPGGRFYAESLIQVAQQYGVTMHVTSVYRTFEEQTYYYNLRQKGQWPYPVAVPGTSAHEFGYAFDLGGGSHADMRALASIWRGWGGITFDYDPVHFQFPGFSAPQVGQQVGTGISGQNRRVFDQLADLLLYFIPGVGQVLGKAQLAAALFQILSGSTSSAAWYVQHPIEAIRDFQDWLIGLLPEPLASAARVAVAPFGQ